MFDFDGFAERVEVEQHSEQRKVLAVQTMDRLRAQLIVLAGLGYQLDLVDLAPHPSVETQVDPIKTPVPTKAAETKPAVTPPAPTKMV